MRKFPKVKYPSDPETDGLFNGDVVVTEKIDGANFRFTWNEHGEPVFGSRKVKFTEDGEPLSVDETNKDFRHVVKYLRDELPSSLDQPDLEDYTIFGEAMHMHTLQYDDIEYTQASYGGMPHASAEGNRFIMFDAWDNGAGEWLDWQDVVQLSADLGLQLVPVIGMGSEEFLEDNDALEIPDESAFGGEPEGVVARRVDGTVRAKKVTEDFSEKNAVAFNDPSKAQGDAAEFVAMFVTPGRVRSVAHSLVDEGPYDGLKMEMMEDLPKAVIRDIFAEEGWNLICNEYGFEADFDDEFKSEVRSKVSSSCATLLKKEINDF